MLSLVVIFVSTNITNHQSRFPEHDFWFNLDIISMLVHWPINVLMCLLICMYKLIIYVYYLLQLFTYLWIWTLDRGRGFGPIFTKFVRNLPFVINNLSSLAERINKYWNLRGGRCSRKNYSFCAKNQTILIVIIFPEKVRRNKAQMLSPRTSL